jgi:hypothetical protein
MQQFVKHYLGKMQNFKCCKRWYIYLPYFFEELLEYRLVLYTKPIVTNPRNSNCTLLSTECVQRRQSLTSRPGDLGKDRTL